MANDKPDMITKGVSDKERQMAEKARKKIEGCKYLEFISGGVLTRKFYQTEEQKQRIIQRNYGRKKGAHN